MNFGIGNVHSIIWEPISACVCCRLPFRLLPILPRIEADDDSAFGSDYGHEDVGSYEEESRDRKVHHVKPEDRRSPTRHRSKHGDKRSPTRHVTKHEDRRSPTRHMAKHEDKLSPFVKKTGKHMTHDSVHERESFPSPRLKHSYRDDIEQ